MKNHVLLAVGMLFFGTLAVAGPLGYSLTGKASYQTGCGPLATVNLSEGTCGSPATAFVVLTNTGTSAFTGSAYLFGIAPAQTIVEEIAGTLAPGQSWGFGAGPRSSAQGGFNKIPGQPDFGLMFFLTGTLDGESFGASVSDSGLHSGVFRTNPFGVLLDNYIMQGGDPLGRDTGNAFATTQAPATFVWQASASDVTLIASTPEPGTLTLLGLALAGLAAVRRRFPV
ncbi:MAG: PEP-CTERM sorting domain-containing protein [Bryobacterales bacterium]|nr:PEP-CTERM sorting domain-containing protein [Bryobacterales bacterium]